MHSRGKDMSKLKTVLDLLINREDLPSRYRDRKLKGKFGISNCRECHIEPDWFLVYKINEKKMTLTAIDMGTHSDLFKE
jgi:mRNA interferase YafQ